MSDLQNRGVERHSDSLRGRADRLPGGNKQRIYPRTEVQLCDSPDTQLDYEICRVKTPQSVHVADLKPVYRAVSKTRRETALDELEEKWGQQYPVVLQSWRRKWESLSAYFRYPANIRKSFTPRMQSNRCRQFRGLTKTKGLSSENSLLKLLYLGLMNAREKWTMPIQSWVTYAVGDLF